VPEFLTWQLFPAWKSALEALGYSLAPHVLDAADHGIPQNRVRAFIVVTRSRSPLWLKLPKREHVAAEAILTNAGQWSPIRRMCPNTRARIKAGRARHGSRFLIAYYGNEKGGRSTSRPIGTITTRDRWALVDGDRMKMLSADECRAAMGFRPDYIVPTSSTLTKHMLGNAVCPPVAADIITALKHPDR
jgi:DNA (cytosine-5)-methyltransferase 1